MSDATSTQPSWMKFADFQGPTPEEEHEAIRLDQIKGKNFKRNQRNPLRCLGQADGAGVWGVSKHRGAGKNWS